MGMPGYHLIVWKDGGAAMAALFRAEVTDTEVLDALERLGAKPGNALGMEVWEDRKDPASKAPDQVIQGPPVEILVRVPGRKEPLRLDQILEDPGGTRLRHAFRRPPGEHPEVEVRDAWSASTPAPGARSATPATRCATIEKETTRFRVRPGVLPEDGTRVTIIFRLK